MRAVLVLNSSRLRSFRIERTAKTTPITAAHVIIGPSIGSIVPIIAPLSLVIVFLDLLYHKHSVLSMFLPSRKSSKAKSRRRRVCNPQLACGMELDRKSVWNQSEGKIHADACCHAVAKRRIPCTALRAVILYQSFGLDRKKQVFRLAFFLGVLNLMTRIKYA